MSFDTPTTDVSGDKFGLFVQAVIQSWWEGTAIATGEYGLPDQPPAVLYRLLMGLGQVIKQARSLRRLHYPPCETSLHLCNNKDKLVPAQTYIIYATAFKAMVNWPDGFYALLDALRQSHGGRTSGLVQQDLGIIYNVWLERNWRHPVFSFVQEAFNGYLAHHYPVTTSVMRLRRFKEDPTFKDLLAYMTEAEAAQKLRVIPATVKRLVKLGWLVSYEQVEPDAPPQWYNLIRQAEVAALCQRWRHSYHLETAADRLGLQHDTVVELVKAGLLEAVRGPIIDDNQEWYLSRDSVQGLQEKIRQISGSLLLASIPLAKAAQMLSVYGYNIAGVLQFILDGKLRVEWAGKRLGQIVIAVDDIEKLIESIRADRPLLTRQQVAQMMKVKIPTVTAWVKRGLLVPVEEKQGGLYFDRQAVYSFIEEHLFAEEAAELLGVGVLAVQKWARNGRLQAVSGPGVDDLHRYLFRREEVERLKPDNRLTGPQLAERLGISRSQLWVRVKQGKVRPVSGPGIDGSKHYLFMGENGL